MVQARSPCGAEWVRESRSKQSQDSVGSAGISPVTGRRAILGETPVARQSGIRVNLGSNEGGTAERLLRLRPFWDGGFLRSAPMSMAVRGQRWYRQ